MPKGLGYQVTIPSSCWVWESGLRLDWHEVIIDTMDLVARFIEDELSIMELDFITS